MLKLLGRNICKAQKVGLANQKIVIRAIKLNSEFKLFLFVAVWTEWLSMFGVEISYKTFYSTDWLLNFLSREVAFCNATFF